MTSELMQWLTLGMLMVICAGMVINLGMLRDVRPRGLTGCVGPVLFTMILLALLFVFVFVRIRSPYHQQGFLIPPGTEPWALAFAGACAGFCLFFLRGWHKGVYGLVEVAVAVIVLIVSSLNMSVNNVTTNTVGFLSAIYVLVRGLTNIGEYLQARDPTDRP